MPFYKRAEMEVSNLAAQPMGKFQGLAGELMKVDFVTYEKGKLSRPHYHPNEEQIIYIIEGRQYMVLGEEEGIVGPGDLVHIPRNTKHGGIIIDERTVMFAAKSPAGNGNLAQDHNDAEDAEEITAHLKRKYEEYTKAD